MDGFQPGVLSCNSSDPTVQALSDQIEFDRLLSREAVIQSKGCSRDGLKPAAEADIYPVLIKRLSQPCA